MKTKESMQFICLTKDEQLGAVDITALLPDICLKCQNSDFSVKTHRLYGNDVICDTCVQVVCSRNSTCNYIMEMMKRDEQADSPPR